MTFHSDILFILANKTTTYRHIVLYHFHRHPHTSVSHTWLYKLTPLHNCCTSISCSGYDLLQVMILFRIWPLFNLDDILIYSETLEEHQAHMKKVLEALSKVGLHLKPEKCEFHKTEVKYLGLIISVDSGKMDQKKVKDVVEWGSPKNLYDVRAFLGFSNFCRWFILGYSEVVSPIIKLMKKDVKFV